MGYVIGENGERIYIRGDSDIYEEECPNCGFEYAHVTRFLDTRNKHLLCTGCGFCEDEEIDEENSDFPRLIVWKCQEKDGEGAYVLARKSEPNTVEFRSANREVVKQLKANIFKFMSCKYTFRRKGEWLIRDLIAKETMPFSYEDFRP